MKKFWEIFSDLNKNKNGNFHNLLIKVKESFELINKDMKKIIKEIKKALNTLDAQYNNRKESLISLEDKFNQII